MVVAGGGGRDSNELHFFFKPSDFLPTRNHFLTCNFFQSHCHGVILCHALGGGIGRCQGVFSNRSCRPRKCQGYLCFFWPPLNTFVWEPHCERLSYSFTAHCSQVVPYAVDVDVFEEEEVIRVVEVVTEELVEVPVERIVPGLPGGRGMGDGLDGGVQPVGPPEIPDPW